MVIPMALDNNTNLLVNSHNIDVATIAAYIPSQSLPDQERFVFSYTITITNNSDIPVKLLSRYWLITDANGDITTVEGDGVIGQTPTILPTKSFSYSSGSLMKTPVGTMQGYYQMHSKNGELLQVNIPVFRLAIPNILN